MVGETLSSFHKSCLWLLARAPSWWPGCLCEGSGGAEAGRANDRVSSGGSAAPCHGLSGLCLVLGPEHPRPQSFRPVKAGLSFVEGWASALASPEIRVRGLWIYWGNYLRNHLLGVASSPDKALETTGGSCRGVLQKSGQSQRRLLVGVGEGLLGVGGGWCLGQASPRSYRCPRAGTSARTCQVGACPEVLERVTEGV